MQNILVRGLSDEAVKHIDSEAHNLGLSRNEFLRRKIEQTTDSPQKESLTQADWSLAAEVLADLSDPEVMDAAWQ